MSEWTLDRPPYYFPTAVATDKGWEDPTTGEVLIAIRGLTDKAGGADCTGIAFCKSSYIRGDALEVVATFNEKVDVTAGATVLVTSSTGANYTLYAAEQTNTRSVTFNMASDLTSAVTLRDEETTLTIGNQTIGAGPIKDNADTVKATGVLTFTDQPHNGDTCKLGDATYTYQTTLTDVDGNVAIGSTLALSINNLCQAINAGVGAGVQYAESTTANLSADATNTATVLTAKALTGGTAGNSITTEETLAHASWAYATLTSGLGVTSSMSVPLTAASPDRVAATGTLTVVVTGGIDDTETVKIGDTTYTFTSAMNATKADKTVLVGATTEASLSNLVAAINLLASQSGVGYSANTTVADTNVTAVEDLPNLAVILTAKTAGTAGNSITTETDITDASFGAATLTGGTAAGNVRTIVSANVAGVTFGAASYTRGATLSAIVSFDEPVDVAAGANIFLTSTQTGFTSITLYAAAQLNTETVTFNRTSVVTAFATVPDASGTLSVGAQTVVGTVVDTGTSNAAVTTISSDIGTAAGTRVIAAPAVLSVSFGQTVYAGNDDLVVNVVYDHPVDVTAHASLGICSTGTTTTTIAYASAQSAVTTAVFDKQTDNATGLKVPNELGTLSINAQTLGGTITDAVTHTVNASHTVTTTQASLAGTREVAHSGSPSPSTSASPSASVSASPSASASASPSASPSASTSASPSSSDSASASPSASESASPSASESASPSASESASPSASPSASASSSPG